jgi:hypothetical protein
MGGTLDAPKKAPCSPWTSCTVVVEWQAGSLRTGAGTDMLRRKWTKTRCYVFDGDICASTGKEENTVRRIGGRRDKS